MVDKTEQKQKKKEEGKAKEDKVPKNRKETEKKTIIVGTKDIESLVIDSVSDLLDKGVLAESEDGTKIDLKEQIEYEKKKKKKKDREEQDEE